MKSYYFITVVVFTTLSVAGSAQIILDSISDGSGYTYIAGPSGAGPFPAVLYNHGGLGPNVGGDMRGTAVALAQAGYFVRCEKRMETFPITGHLEEVKAALDSLRADPRSDINCVTIMGFSRGGYLTLEAAKQNPGKVHGIISMAPANPAWLLDTLVSDVSPVDDPVLVLVAENDTFQDKHVMLAQMVYDSLIAAGKTAALTVYPGYDSNGDSIVDGSDDGHELFWVVQNPYWTDVINFLNSFSCMTTGRNSTFAETSEIKIYPGPATRSATLEFDNSGQENRTLVVYGTQGRLERTIKNITIGRITIDTDGLTSGLYFFQLHSDNKIVASGKLIKE